MSGSVSVNHIPANIITGFLGVGKTTAILHLLKSKPASERWAVLVNEFGEIGVDGSLISGLHSEEQGVFIREVPGGCMCCAAGLPMKVALNQLLTHSKPDRLLIEPTGLGHPHEVLHTLSGEMYRNVLSVQQIITLVNARHLSDERYTNNETFKQQIAIADTVVGNKTDLYQHKDEEKLLAFVKTTGKPNARVSLTTNGEIDRALLTGQTDFAELPDQPASHHHHADTPAEETTPIPECGYIKKNNRGEGYTSVGWRFSADSIFHYERLFNLLTGIDADRLKAVFNTDKGVYGYNMASGSLSEIRLQHAGESSIEIIGGEMNDDREDQLLLCRLAEPDQPIL